MFTDEDLSIFWDVDDESLMANSLLDIVPVFAQNDVFLFFNSEPFATFTAEQRANIIEWYNSGWTILTSIQNSSTWNIAYGLARDFAWNILSVLSDGAEWRIFGSSEIESAYHIIIDHVEETIWYVLDSSDIASVWNLLNEINLDASWRDISATELLSLWNIIGLYSMDTQTIWNILTDRSRPVEWRVRTALRMGLLWILRSETPISRYILDELVAYRRDLEFVADECEFEIEATEIQYMIEVYPVEARHNEADSVEFEFMAIPKGGWM